MGYQTMEAKGTKQATRSRSSSSSSSSDSGSVTPNFSREKNDKTSSRKTDVRSSYGANGHKTPYVVNRDKVRLVGGKLVREDEIPRHFSGRHDLTAVMKKPRLALSHTGAVLHFIA